MSNSQDILLSCYDGKILALVDQKKFKKQGIMGQENIQAIQDSKQQAIQEKEKKDKIVDMKKEME